MPPRARSWRARRRSRRLVPPSAHRTQPGVNGTAERPSALSRSRGCDRVRKHAGDTRLGRRAVAPSARPVPASCIGTARGRRPQPRRIPLRPPLRNRLQGAAELLGSRVLLAREPRATSVQHHAVAAALQRSRSRCDSFGSCRPHVSSAATSSAVTTVSYRHAHTAAGPTGTFGRERCRLQVNGGWVGR